MKSSCLIRTEYAELDKERACTVIRALGPKQWRVTIEEAKSRRSQNQNRYLWLIYGEIIKNGGEAMQGWRPEELHEFFLIEHFGHEVHDIFGKKKLVPLNRSSKLSKAEFADFVAHIQQFMAERGMFLPDPEAM